MKNILAIPLLFFIVQSSFGQHKAYIHLKKRNQGKYCYLLWTTDIIKCNPKDTISKIYLDKKNVAYVHIDIARNTDSIRCFNQKGQNISSRMFNIMSGEGVLYFYYPTDKEYKKHPHYDQYYINKLSKVVNYSPFLEKLGYKLERLKVNK